jgi:hypothetical protein
LIIRLVDNCSSEVSNPVKCNRPALCMLVEILQVDISKKILTIFEFLEAVDSTLKIKERLGYTCLNFDQNV